MTSKKVPVSARAVVQRIKRRIAKQDEKLVTARSMRTRIDCGQYYIVDTRMNAVVMHDIDIETYAREIGVLADYEVLVNDEDEG